MSGCVLVLTLKMVFKGRESRRLVVQEAGETLGAAFENILECHLFSNTAHETTMLAIKS